MDSIRLVCHIDIIAMYDRNGYEISTEHYKVALSTNNRCSKERNYEYKDEEKYVMDNDDDEELLLSQHETPGYVADDDDGNMKLLKQQIKDLQKQVKLLMSELDKNKDSKNDNNGNNGNHVEIFEKWYTLHIQLPQYYDLLIEAGFDSMLAVTHLTDDDLKELGIERKGHRIKILKTIQQSQLL